MQKWRGNNNQGIFCPSSTIGTLPFTTGSLIIISKPVNIHISLSSLLLLLKLKSRCDLPGNHPRSIDKYCPESDKACHQYISSISWAPLTNHLSLYDKLVNSK